MLFHLERDNQHLAMVSLQGRADAGGTCGSEHDPALH
jgi:hypothetical protein